MELRPVLLYEIPSPHATGWTVGAKFFAPAQPGPESHLALYTVCTGSRRYSPTPI